MSGPAIGGSGMMETQLANGSSDKVHAFGTEPAVVGACQIEVDVVRHGSACSMAPYRNRHTGYPFDCALPVFCTSCMGT